METHVQLQLGYSTGNVDAPFSTPTEDDGETMLVLLYIRGPSERICLVCCPLGIKVAFRSSSALRNLFTHIKTPRPTEEQWCMVTCSL